jgi:hypothetical protein
MALLSMIGLTREMERPTSKEHTFVTIEPLFEITVLIIGEDIHTIVMFLLINILVPFMDGVITLGILFTIIGGGMEILGMVTMITIGSPILTIQLQPFG